MNVLITCVGRRVELVKWFKEELNKIGRKLFVIDRDKYAPALYYADKYDIMEQEYNQEFHYIDNLVKFCIKNDIKYILTLIDNQLLLFANNAYYFKQFGIEFIGSEKNIVKDTFDKMFFYEKFKDKINIPETLVIKNRTGSASIGLEYIKQPFIDGQEYNASLYFDFNYKLRNVFIQRKILMRAGETERSISCYDEDIYKELLKLDNLGFKGVIDCDIIKSDKVYIIDINPRFGGAYPLAHYCGFNYVKQIVNEIDGKELENYNDYKNGIVMMKYNGLLFKENL